MARRSAAATGLWPGTSAETNRVDKDSCIDCFNIDMLYISNRWISIFILKLYITVGNIHIYIYIYVYIRIYAHDS